MSKYIRRIPSQFLKFITYFCVACIKIKILSQRETLYSSGLLKKSNMRPVTLAHHNTTVIVLTVLIFSSKMILDNRTRSHMNIAGATLIQLQSWNSANWENKVRYSKIVVRHEHEVKNSKSPDSMTAEVCDFIDGYCVIVAQNYAHELEGQEVWYSAVRKKRRF